MKKLLILSVLLILALAIHARPHEKFTGSILWKISGNGLEKPSYILGTFHILTKSHLEKLPGFNEASLNTEQTVGEIIMSDMQALGTKMQTAAILPPDSTYNLWLSNEEYKLLDDELKNTLRVGLDVFGKMKPGMISSIYTVMIYSKIVPGFMANTSESMDIYLQDEARKKGKSVLGLETAEHQIYTLYDALPWRTQAKNLVLGIKHKDYMLKMAAEAVKDYNDGNLAKLYADSFLDPDSPTPVSEEERNILLKNRNDKWMEQLPAIMNSKPSLIVVGALHLAGEEGLLYQLDKMGYTVEPLK